MPYKSEAQSRYIHMKANDGEGWAKKFVSDAQHGEGSVRALPERAARKRRLKGKRKKRSK